MKNRLRFQKQYFIFAMLLLLIEVLIARYAHDKIIRPYVGDFLVVILLYCIIRSCWNSSPLFTGIFVLLFAFMVEASQYIKLATLLGLQNSKLATIILGSTFEWMDLIAYTAGIAVVLYIENIRVSRKTNPSAESGFPIP